MISKLGAVSLLAAAMVMPVQDAQAQDILGGAIVGGVTGGLIGGAVGGRKGAAVGVGVGAVTGATIAAQGQQRRAGYYWYEGRCWFRDPGGEYRQVSRRNCDL
ncbi:MAG: hypothetical protein HY659_06860 [Rhizobiales bacterium]|nr:hypothetical protein [Hyphomicrobiales bacterium]